MLIEDSSSGPGQPVASPVRKRPGPPPSVECLEDGSDDPKRTKLFDDGDSHGDQASVPFTVVATVPQSSSNVHDTKCKVFVRAGGLTHRQVWLSKTTGVHMFML